MGDIRPQEKEEAALARSSGRLLAGARSAAKEDDIHKDALPPRRVSGGREAHLQDL